MKTLILCVVLLTGSLTALSQDVTQIVGHPIDSIQTKLDALNCKYIYDYNANYVCNYIAIKFNTRQQLKHSIETTINNAIWYDFIEGQLNFIKNDSYYIIVAATEPNKHTKRAKLLILRLVDK